MHDSANSQLPKVDCQSLNATGRTLNAKRRPLLASTEEISFTTNSPNAERQTPTATRFNRRNIIYHKPAERRPSAPLRDRPTADRLPHQPKNQHPPTNPLSSVVRLPSSVVRHPIKTNASSRPNLPPAPCLSHAAFRRCWQCACARCAD